MKTLKKKKKIFIYKIFRHNASEHNIKRNVSTQTLQTINNEYHTIIRNNYPEITKPYEKLKKCLYPDLFDNQQNIKGCSNIFILI